MLDSFVAGLITGGARTLTGVRARWTGCLPTSTQRIYFANHASHFDFVLLWSSLPAALRAHTRPVAARDYWQQHVIRPYLINRVFRGVLVDRVVGRNANPLTAMLDALDRGDSLILFPEGTRGSGKELLPFKSGLYHVAAARPLVELVPAWIANSSRVMPKGAFLPAPMLCSVTFGEPLRLAPAEEKQAFLDRARDRLASLDCA